MNHAPAPWTWDGSYPIRIIDAQGYVVCGDILPSGAGNVGLITAAPWLLEALKYALVALESGNGDAVLTAQENARAAISKAEGK